MKNENQIWDEKLREALKVDRESEVNEKLRRVWPYLSKNSREKQIYELIVVWGFTQARVAEHLGISQQAVSKCLKKFLEKNSDKKPLVFVPRIGFLPDGFHVAES